MPKNGDPDFEAYETILDVNTGGRGSQLMFEPPDLDLATNTWGNGRPLGEYDPSPQQIVDWLSDE